MQEPTAVEAAVNGEPANGEQPEINAEPESADVQQGAAAVEGENGEAAAAQEATASEADDSRVNPPAGEAATATATTVLPADGELEVVSASEVLPDGRIMFNFQNASIDSVLTFLAEAADLVVISSGRLEGRVSVINRQPMTIEEAMLVLDSLLKDRGYAAVRTGKTIRILSLDSAKQANIPVQMGNDPELIVESDRILTQVVPVRYADAAQLRRDLAPLVPAYADLSANASTNTLIITDTGANVRRLVTIIRALDTSVSAVTQVKVFNLQYASASNAARLINEVFRADTPVDNNRQGQQQRINRFFRGGNQPGGQASNNSEEGNRPQTRVTAAADDRTNTLVISAPVDIMPAIELVIADLDANPAQEQAVFTYRLKNGNATNLESVVNELFSTSNTNRSSGGGGNAQRNNRGNAAANRLNPTAAQAASDLAGQVSVVADPDTNSLLVMTGTSNFDRVRAILEDLDRPVPQVLIKVLLAEVTHDNEIDIGTEFSAINLRSSGDTSVFTDFALATVPSPGGLVVKLVESDITVAMRALERIGKLNVLSRPYILTKDNQNASIIVGQRVPFITQSRTTDTGQTINTIQYEDLGIILNVVPHINPDGLVILDVAPEISSITGTTVPISETVEAPVFAKRAAETRVAVQDGQTIVIGGLIEDRETKQIHKVPILGDIPILGLLLQRHQKIKAKTELLIFLTPHVAQVPDELAEISRQEQEAAELVPEAIGPGEYQRHLEGMQRGKLHESAKP